MYKIIIIIISRATFCIIGLTKIPKIEFLPLDWIYHSIRIITVIVKVWVLGQTACQENVAEKSCAYCMKYDQLECCDCLQYVPPLNENYNEDLERIALAINASIYRCLHIVT